MLHPVSRPSAPSVRLVALLVAMTMTRISTTTAAAGSTKLSKSRMKDSENDAGRWPRSSSSTGLSARMPKVRPTTVWPTILALLRSPRLRCL